MSYRSKKYWVVVVAMVVGLVGAYGSTRAQDPSSDLEQQLKQKEAQYKELEQKLKAERDEANDHSKEVNEQAKKVNEQARKIAENARQQAEQFRFTVKQPGLRTRVEPSVAEAIQKAAAEVRDAKGDEDKSAAQKKLNESLSKYFDEDMVQREKEVKQVEERVTKLRDLLDRRRSSKQEIIDLEAKVALNQANGLGFYDGEAADGGAPNPFFGWGTSGSSGSNSWGAVDGKQTIVVPRAVSVPAVVPVAPVAPIPPIDPNVPH